MKRTEDFLNLIKATHTLGESLALQPETPDGYDIDYLIRIERDRPVFDNPYAKSAIRESGLGIWDSVYIPLPSSIPLIPKNLKDISPRRSINEEWEQVTKKALGKIGRPDGIHYLRPKGEFIFDAMNDDIRLLQAAHVLTHRFSPCHQDDWSFGELSADFFRNLVKLFLAHKFDLSVRVSPESDLPDSFELYGISVLASVDLRSPSIIAPVDVDSTAFRRDRTVCAVLGSIGIEAHPRQAEDGEAWKSVNRWACLPTLVALAGWECTDYIYHTEKTEVRGSLCNVAPAADLQEMGSFCQLIEKAVSERGLPELRHPVYKVNDWLESDDFRRGLSVTPQLPCPHCIRLNRGAPGLVKKPYTPKPDRPLKDLEQSTRKEVVEWVEYVRFMRRCLSIGRKATAYALGSVTAPARRNSRFKKRAEVLRKIESLERRYARKHSNGYLAEASVLLEKANKLRESIKDDEK